MSSNPFHLQAPEDLLPLPPPPPQGPINPAGTPFPSVPPPSRIPTPARENPIFSPTRPQFPPNFPRSRPQPQRPTPSPQRQLPPPQRQLPPPQRPTLPPPQRPTPPPQRPTLPPAPKFSQPVLTVQQKLQQQQPPQNLGSWLNDEPQPLVVPPASPIPYQMLGRVTPTRPSGRVSPGKQEIRDVPTPKTQPARPTRSPQELDYYRRKYQDKNSSSSSRLTTPIVKFPEAKSRYWGTMEAPEEVYSAISRPWYQSSQSRPNIVPRPFYPSSQQASQQRPPVFRSPTSFRPPTFRPLTPIRPAVYQAESLIKLSAADIVEMFEDDLLLILENIGKQNRLNVFKQYPDLRKKYSVYFDD